MLRSTGINPVTGSASGNSVAEPLAQALHSATQDAEIALFAAKVTQLSTQTPTDKNILVGKLPNGIDLGRGVLQPDYPLSTSGVLGHERKIDAARGGESAQLEIAKLRSGSICHNITIELSARNRTPAGQDAGPLTRTATLFFPSQAVREQAQEMLNYISEDSPVGSVKTFSLLQLADPTGRPLASNFLNVLESSAQRWGELFSPGHRCERFDVSVERIDSETVKLSFNTDFIDGRRGPVPKSTTYYLTENRLLTTVEHAALKEIYAKIPEGMSRQEFAGFRSGQFYAWLWRKYLEPGGDSHATAQDLGSIRESGLESLFYKSNGLQGQDERTFIFASSISLGMINNLLSLGADNIKQMRITGEKLLLCGVTLDKGEFTAINITQGVPCLGSDPAILDTALVLTGGNLHHQAWMATRNWMNSKGAPELKMESRREHKPYSLEGGISNDWVRDCGNFYGKCFLLGSLPHENYGRLLQLAEAFEPRAEMLTREQTTSLLAKNRDEASSSHI